VDLEAILPRLLEEHDVPGAVVGVVDGDGEPQVVTAGDRGAGRGPVDDDTVFAAASGAGSSSRSQAAGGRGRSRARRSPELAEAPSELLDEERRLLQSGEVAAPVDLLEPAKIPVDLLGPAP
jgi:hypothetical protein